MATTAASPTDRPHRAAKRYIYAWGEGTAEGNGGMKDLLGGKGAGLAEMTIAGPPDAARLHDHDRGLQRLLRAGEQLPDGLWDDVHEAMREVERRSGKGFGDAAEPAPRQRPLRREVLDARDDGHGPQPRASTRRRSRA